MADLVGSNGERKAFNIVGKPNIPGRLSYSIATGKARFGTDVIVPNMLFAKFLRSPYGRARVKSMDISKAKCNEEAPRWQDARLELQISDVSPACHGNLFMHCNYSGRRQGIYPA